MYKTFSKLVGKQVRKQGSKQGPKSLLGRLLTFVMYVIQIFFQV